jgi:hypothetical protein|tara:strand:+ start:51 stop:821 length:771 start_codon:yes stop_codon:yes gene_type:complete
MAISVDTVYQKVLVFANKEQRGYITPQEFNLFADQAQMEIFEQYFYDKNQFGRVPGNNYAYSDMVTNLEEKIQLFERYDREADVTYVSNNPSGHDSWGDVNLTTQFPNLYRLGVVRVDYETEPHYRVAEEIQLNELTKYGTSPLGDWTKTRPVYTRYSGANHKNLKVYPYPSSDKTIDRVLITYIQKPSKPNWGYVVVNDKPLYNSNTSTDFELHPAEESELVYKILAFSGIAIEKPQLTQVAAGLEQVKVQQEKQ